MSAEECLRLTIPPQPELVGVVRLAISGLATRLGLDVEAVDDIKLAVAEALNALLADTSCSAPVEVVASWTAAQLVVDLQRPGATIPTDEETSIAEAVMTEFVDQAHFDAEQGHVRLTKRLGAV